MNRYPMLGGLTEADNLVLHLSCEHARRLGRREAIPTEVVQAEAAAQGMAEAAFAESIEALEQQRHIKTPGVLGSRIQPHYTISSHTFERYLSAVVPDYPGMVETVRRHLAEHVVEGRTEDTSSIVRSTGVERLIVDHILERMLAGGEIQASRLSGRDYAVYGTAVSLRRQYRQGAAERTSA